MAAIKDHASDDAGFTKISLSRHNLANSGFVDSSEGVGRKRRMSSITGRYRAEWAQRLADYEITASRHSNSG